METAKSTAKKTTTKKKTTSTTTCKPRTPKPPIEAVAAVVETPKPVKIAPKAEREEKVRVFIPLDPAEPTRVQIVSGSENGKGYELERGKEHLLDKGLAEHILFRIKTAYELEQFVEKTRWHDK